ncbi:MAG: PolC-type DNA polymerase III [Tenericutes bacterium]|nr:PolC-type DNA polymerase III [Mycoplasmatota bacterium]
MDKNMEKLLDKIGFDTNNYQYFSDAKISKIKVNSKNGNWNVFVEKSSLLPLEIYTELEEKKNLLLDANEQESTVHFIYEIENTDLDLYKEYYSYLLKLLKPELKVLEIYEDCLRVEDGKLILVVSNTNEEERLKSVLTKINDFYYYLGYKTPLEIVVRHEENILEEIASELIADVPLPSPVKEEKKEEAPKDKNYRREPKDPNSVLGRGIKEEPIKIKTLLGEDNNVVVEGYVFGTDYFESSKTDFKIITLKITDYSDSIYCKVFVRDNEEYQRLCKELKVGSWFKIRGYTKNDQFAKELVLNARDIIKLEKTEESIKDTAEEKRVELHAHTMMSQMDGVADEVKLVKEAMKWGHKAIAITDHNGVQAFPHVFNLVTSHNKELKEGEEPFKVIYGAEMTLIDDTVNIVVRPNKSVMLEQTFVVFDFETTGFNAGGADSIIEIGAVKIHNGEIIERYDELINPGRPLPQKIIDVTNITDEMLAGKDNEENAVKRFIAWFGDCPMVAHNAKFDVSFLEMAYKKYNLGEFTNPVIDTLELSRTLDNTYARHSLSALVKRYDVPWDEEAHHRGDYDAEGTALVFHKMLNKLSNRNIETMDQLDTLVSKEEIHKYGRAHHVNILAKNKTGLKNLFKIVSLANTTYLYKTPRILRSKIEENREGLLIGSGCYESEVFKEATSKSDDELSNIIRFYDYVEVQPLECYNHLIQTGDFANEVELAANIEKIIRVTEDAGKIIVATGDVHHIRRDDKIYREIIVNQKVPGGGRHPLAKSSITEIPSNHFRTTDEMLSDFKFLGEEMAHRLVIENTNKIADMVDIIEVIPDTGGIPFSPRVKSDDGLSYLDCPVVVTDLVYTKARDWYGEPLPYMIEERIATELYGDIVFKIIKERHEDLKDDEAKYNEIIHKELHDEILKGSDNIKSLVTEYVKRTTEEELDEKGLAKKVKKTLGGVIGGGFDPIYLIAQRLVKHSNDEGYLVGSRGSVGSSFVATMMGITEVNPLPAHYRCLKCKTSIFDDENNTPFAVEYSSGFDLPDKECPNCHEPLYKDGQDMPFATFLGFNADKVPDIDLNFSDLNQASAHAYTKVLFGEDNVYRAGTIGTVADKTAFGFVKGYCEEHNLPDMRTAEVERLAMGCTGVKRTTGQHPGGIVVIPDYKEVFDFTPFQFPAEDATAEWRTTHFDYHAIDQCVLKLDILGHSDPTQLRIIQMQSGTDIMKVPMDDKATMSIFTSTEALGVTKEQIMCNTGTLGIPEFGTSFTIKLVEDTKPTTFGELIKIAGLSHGTDVWLGNAQELIRNNIVPFKETIGCRDDIMVYLMNKGMAPIKAFKIMEFVRKGKATKDPETWKSHVETMKEANIPEWYIESCHKIKYMFPKAHAAAYVMSAFRIAWYKVHMPVYFYSSWYSSKATDVDVEAMIKGYDAIKARLEDILGKGFEATNKENGQAESLKVALEATARGIKFLNVDLYKSDATVWIVKNETEIYPPFVAIDGLGETVAKNIVKEREKQPFISVEDVQRRGKVSQTLIDKMKEMRLLNDLPDSNQLSLF